MFLDWVKKGPADLGDDDIRAYFGRYPRPMGTSAPNLQDGDESVFFDITNGLAAARPPGMPALNVATPVRTVDCSKA